MPSSILPTYLGMYVRTDPCFAPIALRMALSDESYVAVGRWMVGAKASNRKSDFRAWNSGLTLNRFSSKRFPKKCTASNRNRENQ